MGALFCSQLMSDISLEHWYIVKSEPFSYLHPTNLLWASWGVVMLKHTKVLWVHMPDICGKCSLIPRPPGEVGGGAGDEAMVRGSTQQYVTILKKFVDRIITIWTLGFIPIASFPIWHIHSDCNKMKGTEVPNPQCSSACDCTCVD